LLDNHSDGLTRFQKHFDTTNVAAKIPATDNGPLIKDKIMQLTPEQKQLGKENFNEAVGFSRREFLTGLGAAGTGLGAAYFGYEKLKGERVRVGFIGSGDEGRMSATATISMYSGGC